MSSLRRDECPTSGREGRVRSCCPAVRWRDCRGVRIRAQSQTSLPLRPVWAALPRAYWRLASLACVVDSVLGFAGGRHLEYAGECRRTLKNCGILHGNKRGAAGAKQKRET